MSAERVMEPFLSFDETSFQTIMYVSPFVFIFTKFFSCVIISQMITADVAQW